MADPFEEVASGVFVYHHDWADGTCAIVLGPERAVAVDGSGDPSHGRAMADFLRAHGHEPTRLIYTHGHGDHVWGALPLGAGEVIAHELTPAVMRRQLPAWAAGWGVSQAEAAARVPWPTLTFNDEVRVHLGGERALRLLRTPGHSEDGVSVLVEDAGVLIAGDCAATGIVPALSDGDGRTLEASLRLLADMDLAVLVPGHGPVVRGPEVRDWLLWGADYLLAVRRRVRQRLRVGDPLDAVAAAVSYDEFVGNRLRPECHGMPRRHAAAVAKVIEEEIPRLPGVVHGR